MAKESLEDLRVEMQATVNKELRLQLELANVAQIKAGIFARLNAAVIMASLDKILDGLVAGPQTKSH